MLLEEVIKIQDAKVLLLCNNIVELFFAKKQNIFSKDFNDYLENNEDLDLNDIKTVALEVVLNHLSKQEKIIDELENGVHYQECINCGKEMRVKRVDAKYCDECTKSRQKDYFKNMSNEKKKERAEKSKIYMRQLRAKRKAKENKQEEEN